MAHGTYAELLDIFKELPNYDEVLGWRKTVCGRIESLGIDHDMANAMFADIFFTFEDLEHVGVIRYERGEIYIEIDVPYIFRKNDGVTPILTDERGNG